MGRRRQSARGRPTAINYSRYARVAHDLVQNSSTSNHRVKQDVSLMVDNESIRM